MSENAGQPGVRRELYVRHARLDGRSVAVLRAIDEGHRCVIEADVWAKPGDHPYAAVGTRPYVFPSPVEATRFVTQVVESLIVLGCDVHSS